MRNLLSAFLVSSMLIFPVGASAYTIGGMYVSLVSCDWGQYGYEYGYIGIYEGNDGQTFQQFFGDSYCEY